MRGFDSRSHLPSNYIMQKIRLLAIETSCDETGIAIIEFEKKIVKKQEVISKEFKVIKNLLISQIDIHKDYGGVYPNLAKREHIKNIPILLEQALGKDDNFKNINYIAVTYGPGLSPALWTGIEAAKTISKEYNIPVLPINHMEGHIFSSLLTAKNKKGDIYEIITPSLPSIALLISGGHTELIYMNNFFKYKKVGHTLDDAVGEAFDKVARSIGLSYPGGPEISKKAESGRREIVALREELRLPRPMLHSKDLNFSFSGLKTSVINKIEKYKLTEEEKNLFCMEFENAVTDVLIKKTREALYLYNCNSLIVGGGVSANNHIRKSLTEMCKNDDIDIYLSDKKNSTDNALMIAAIAFAKVSNSHPALTGEKVEDIKAEPNLKL
ncbi:MAG: hypothetical protein QG614_633 [Patescibacteria group bacterium]|nr:hypothetical protein [Patescibacteria group bacterium]